MHLPRIAALCGVATTAIVSSTTVLVNTASVINPSVSKRWMGEWLHAWRNL